ncbi:hypothetical protein DMENIID0001_158440 [Sergentomyia squamirostris]
MSDRGTDFIGAKRQLDEDIEKALHRNQDKVMDYTSSQEIKWEFIPPGAPHFGGIWEAAVKSVKYHLTRVIGLHKLTYEELSTLLAQIEACVNSRPLVILSEDDSQMEALTPGHFLIGRPLTAPPVEDLSNANPIQRWRLLTKIQQQIWKRWSEEYLTSLQQRNKWFKTQENPEVGQMVLLKEDNLPPLKWVLAKITKLHPGKDNLVRVVTIRLKGNKYKEAPVHKLVPLPATANTTDPGPQGGPPRTIDVYEKAIAQFKKQQKKLVETSNADILKPKQGVTAKKAEKCNNSKNMQTPPSKQSLDPIQNIQNISHQNSKPSPSPNSPQSPSSLTDSTSSTSYEDTNRDGTTQTRRRPITRAMARGTFLTIFHVILLITSVMGNNYTLFKPEPGLYIEKPGTAQLDRGLLRIDLTFQLQSFDNEWVTVTSIVNKTTSLCEETKKLSTTSQCASLLSHLSHEKDMLENRLEEIHTLKPTAEKRPRRGIFGKIINFFLGTSDDEYTHLDSLQFNNNALLKTMNQQTLLLNTRISQSNEITQQKLKIFEERAGTLTDTIQEMKTWETIIDSNQLEIRMINTYMGALNYINELNEKYEEILRVLIEKGSGIGLVNNKILKDRFEEAEKKTTPGFTILKNPAIAAKFKMTNESLSIYIYFNIVETSSFELLRVTPIPRQVENDTFIIQKIPHSLIGINHHDEKYFTTDDDNINNCKEIQERKYLCNIDVVYNNPEHSSCVFNDISKKNNHTSCEWKKVKIDGIIWKKLNTENTWLFITAYPNNAAIVCSNKREEVSLNQLGILHLHRECFLKTTKLTLRSTFMTKTQAESIFNKPMTFPDINTTTFKEIKPVILRTPTVIKSSEDIYEKTALPVPTVMMMEVMPISRTTTISISATIALAIIALILWYTKRIWISLIRRCCQRPTHIEDQPATLQPSLAQQLNEILERRSPPAIRHSMDAL